MVVFAEGKYGWSNVVLVVRNWEVDLHSQIIPGMVKRWPVCVSLSKRDFETKEKRLVKCRLTCKGLGNWLTLCGVWGWGGREGGLK